MRPSPQKGVLVIQHRIKSFKGGQKASPWSGIMFFYYHIWLDLWTWDHQVKKGINVITNRHINFSFRSLKRIHHDLGRCPCFFLFSVLLYFILFLQRLKVWLILIGCLIKIFYLHLACDSSMRLIGVLFFNSCLR